MNTNFKYNEMRPKNLKLCGILLFELSLVGLQAQNAVPSSGGIANGSGGSAAYSIGQVNYTSLSGSSGSAIQGVEQAYEISVVTAIEAANDISLQCFVYPNPTQDFLVLKVAESVTGNLNSMSYQLLNSIGTVLDLQKIVSNETTINTSNLETGCYFVKVVQLLEKDRKIELKTFKIIKK